MKQLFVISRHRTDIVLAAFLEYLICLVAMYAYRRIDQDYQQLLVLRGSRIDKHLWPSSLRSQSFWVRHLALSHLEYTSLVPVFRGIYHFRRSNCSKKGAVFARAEVILLGGRMHFVFYCVLLIKARYSLLYTPCA